MWKGSCVSGREDGSGYKASGRVSLKQLADSDDASRRPPGLKGPVLSSLTLLLVGSASSSPRIHAAGPDGQPLSSIARKAESLVCAI